MAGGGSFVAGLFEGYFGAKSKQRWDSHDARQAGQAADAEHQRKLQTYQDPRTPEYWGIKLKQEQVLSTRHKRLTEGLEGTTHAMGLEGMAERFIRDNGGTMPDVGSESETAWLSMAASGSSYEESLGGKDEWSDRKNRQGRSIVGALHQTGLDLGTDLKGNSFSLKPDRYGKDMDQLDFLSEAVDEFAPFLPMVTSKTPKFAFDDAMRSAGISSNDPEYAKAEKSFREAQLFWGSGFGASFLESEGQGAPHAAQQALDRVGRARGIMNERRHASAAPPSEQKSANEVVERAMDKAARGSRSNSGDAIRAPFVRPGGKPGAPPRGGPVDGVTGAAVESADGKPKAKASGGPVDGVTGAAVKSADGKPKAKASGGPVDGVTGAAVKSAPGKAPSIFPTKHPVVDNADGTRSNVMTATVELGGKHLVIPTMVEGKQLDIDEAIGIARKEGLENYPTFDNAAEAEAFSKDVHDRVDEDGNMQPKTSARDELIYPDRVDFGALYAEARHPNKPYDPRRMYAESYDPPASYGMKNQTYDQANAAMPQEMAVAPDFSPPTLNMQYKAVKEIIELMVNSPQQVTPAMLATLELKQKQGWWPHLIDGPLEQFKSKISGANHQDAVDALYRGMQLNRPKTHMLGRFK